MEWLFAFGLCAAGWYVISAFIPVEQMLVPGLAWAIGVLMTAAAIRWRTCR